MYIEDKSLSLRLKLKTKLKNLVLGELFALNALKASKMYVSDNSHHFLLFFSLLNGKSAAPTNVNQLRRLHCFRHLLTLIWFCCAK